MSILLNWLSIIDRRRVMHYHTTVGGEMLIDELIRRQKSLNETDRQFAQRLGLSERSWEYAKNDRQFGLALLRGVARAFPDLAQLIFGALVDS